MIFTKNTALAVCINLLMFSSGASNAAEPTAPDAWRQSATLYLWLMSIDGELRFQRDEGDALPIDASQVLDALNMIFMGAYEARKDKWSILGDVIYWIWETKKTGIPVVMIRWNWI